MAIWTLGINAYHGDASGAILRDGELVAAAEEERFTRIKHNAGFPENAIRYCLREAGIELKDVHHIAIARDPHIHFKERVIWNLKRAFCRMSPLWLIDRVFHYGRVNTVQQTLESLFGAGSVCGRVHFVDHHLAHMASSFFPSGFHTAAILSIDAFGDFVSTKWGIGEKGNIRVLGEVLFPHSLGILYTAVTQYLGFPNYGDEYKVMGLAAYGKPVFRQEFSKLIHLESNGQFRLNLKYFRHHSAGVAMTWAEGHPSLEPIFSRELIRLLGPQRKGDEPINKRHEDIAASLQQATEDVLFYVLENVYHQTNLRTLCLAGGVAFNSVANGKMIERVPFHEIFIQPAAGDAGTAVGAAYWTYSRTAKEPPCSTMNHVYYGPSYKRQAILDSLTHEGLKAVEMPENALLSWVAQKIADGKIVGWFQGRMEFGPRALGNRSILADPRRPEMKDELNRRVKRRESFRPYAPAVTVEKAYELFDIDGFLSPFMLLVRPVRSEAREKIPAVIHVDGSARIQTVDRTQNPRFHALIVAFEQLSGVPVLLNTSFNENEPIVESPDQAIACFKRNEMDVLVMENFVVEKTS